MSHWKDVLLNRKNDLLHMCRLLWNKWGPADDIHVDKVYKLP